MLEGQFLVAIGARHWSAEAMALGHKPLHEVGRAHRDLKRAVDRRPV